MNTKWETKLHILMCTIGGFTGAYSLLHCRNIFGAAQTANLICALEALIGRDPGTCLLRLTGLLIYVAGMESCVIIARKTHWNPRKWALLNQAVCLSAAGLLPAKSVFPCLYLLFYMLSIQWSVFHGAGGYTASTIFSTNNLRELTLALGEYFCDKEQKQLEKARFYAGTLLFYHLGVLAALLSYRFLRQASIWLCLLPVLAAAGLMREPQNQSLAIGKSVRRIL